jgi:hypothetical protein
MWEQIHNGGQATRTDGPNGVVVTHLEDYRLQGFNGFDGETLRGIVNQCQMLNAGLTTLMQSFGKPAEGLAQEIKDATAISARAQKMLDRDYTSVVNNPKDFNLSDGQ